MEMMRFTVSDPSEQKKIDAELEILNGQFEFAAYKEDDSHFIVATASFDAMWYCLSFVRKVFVSSHPTKIK